MSTNTLTRIARLAATAALIGSSLFASVQPAAACETQDKLSNGDAKPGETIRAFYTIEMAERVERDHNDPHFPCQE